MVIKREIIHVKDFVSFTLKIYKKINNEIINIGAGKEYSIREFAVKISKIISFKFAKIIFDKKKYTGAKSKKLEIKKIKKIIPSYTKDQIKIEKGLSETINWFKNQLDLID